MPRPGRRSGAARTRTASSSTAMPGPGAIARTAGGWSCPRSPPFRPPRRRRLPRRRSPGPIFRGWTPRPSAPAPRSAARSSSGSCARRRSASRRSRPSPRAVSRTGWAASATTTSTSTGSSGSGTRSPRRRPMSRRSVARSMPCPAERRQDLEPRFAGLDLLASAVVLLDERGHAQYMNLAAEQLFQISWRRHAGDRFSSIFVDGSPIDSLLAEATSNRFDEIRTELALERPGHAPLELHAIAVPVEDPMVAVLVEFRETDHRQRQDREAHLLGSAEANRELVRNLAHEIKNPLGGLRGAAQLLELE